MSYMMVDQPQIILLKDGTDTSQGRGQLISNINACEAVADAIRSTLGPRGMDKLVQTTQKPVISNDGASIMKLLDIVHPAAKTLVDIAQAQDAEVGDGTTTVVLLAAEILKISKEFINEGMHAQVVIRGIRQGLKKVMEHLNAVAIKVSEEEPEKKRQMLEKVAGTALNSKLIRSHRDYFAPMIVDAVCSLDDDLDLGLVGIKKVSGGSVTDSTLIRGVAFEKTFSYAGFEQQPKYFDNPKILLLNLELELKSERDNAEIRINPDQYQSIVDAEWSIIYEKLDRCIQLGANIVLSRLPIGDLATQYFADRGVFCAGRISDEDIKRIERATGAKIQSTVYGVKNDVLGTCGVFEEVQIGSKRYNVFKQCQAATTSTFILRGGAEQFLAEAERSIHDSLMVTKKCIHSNRVVGGGGAVEMSESTALKRYARTIDGKVQLVVEGLAQALEVIPRQLCDNAGFASTEIMNRLRHVHHMATDVCWMGVDIDKEDICDTLEKGVWEPLASKVNSLSSACEAACAILSVDETVKNPKSQQAQLEAQPPNLNMMGSAMGGMRGQKMNLGGMKVMQGRGGK
ncbi:hypothetical protein WA171_001666 [Blastocystis sp. BT1]